MVVGVQVPAAGLLAPEGDHGPKGQVPGHAGIVEGIPRQARLEERAEVAVASAAGRKELVFRAELLFFSLGCS